MKISITPSTPSETNYGSAVVDTGTNDDTTDDLVDAAARAVIAIGRVYGNRALRGLPRVAGSPNGIAPLANSPRVSASSVTAQARSRPPRSSAAISIRPTMKSI